MSVGTFVEKVEALKAKQETIPPAIQTTLHPNLLTRPPTMGPEPWYNPEIISGSYTLE